MVVPLFCPPNKSRYPVFSRGTPPPIVSPEMGKSMRIEEQISSDDCSPPPKPAPDPRETLPRVPASKTGPLPEDGKGGGLRIARSLVLYDKPHVLS